ncbi:MAG: Uma2 family endonuclease [Acidobacteriota bacterium]|nr:Uma2 family endonuclease [Acidobacteriota bacterium]
MIAAKTQSEALTQSVVLYNKSWAFYQQLLAGQEDTSSPRLTFNQGTLEIKVASFQHEQINRQLAELFTTVADELGIDFVHSGSTTFDREDLQRGFQPDSSFYIQHADQIRGKLRINLTVDPPPDLVLEIDITHPSLNKLPIFAAMSIPEIWRFNDNVLTILKLVDGEYIEQHESDALPGAASQQLTELLNNSVQMKRADWLVAVRDWARSLQV